MAHKAKTLTWPTARLPMSVAGQDRKEASQCCAMSSPKTDHRPGHPGQRQGSDGAHMAQDPEIPSRPAYSHAQHLFPGLLEDSERGREPRTR